MKTRFVSMTVETSDTKFMCRLIDWLAKEEAKEGTTTLTMHPDSYKEVESVNNEDKR